MEEAAVINQPQTTLNNSQYQADDLLWRQLKTIPAFRAILRAVESRFYYSVDLAAPMLDVGCGDGHFSQMIFNEQIQAGIDPWWNPLRKSQQAGMYTTLAQAMGDKMPFPAGTFASAFSNSVLEHIPNIQPVLNDVNRVLQMNGRFLITMPSQYFTEWLGGAAFFDKLGADGLADRYRRFFNQISRHEHTVAPEVWASWLATAGFEIERWQYYFSKEALHALELGHVQGIPAAISHALLGHWIIAPWQSSLKLTDNWLRPYYEESFGETGAYLLIVARKVSQEPIAAVLPPARPYSIQKLEANLPYHTPTTAVANPTVTLEKPEPDQLMVETAVEPRPSVMMPAVPSDPSPKKTDFISLGLIGLSLLLAIFAQLNLSSAPDSPGSGLRWYLLAAIPLLLLAWRQHSLNSDGRRPWHWPQLADMSERRLWFVPALLLSYLAYRFVAVFGAERPLLALILWLAAMGLGFYALSGQAAAETEERSTFRVDKFTVVTAVVLFMVALILRLINLSQQPFILSGIEASLGLNTLDIINGNLGNPFGSGWLTNPALLLYLMSIPVRILGPTVTAVRILSPFVGALTVVATFLIGQRLYGRGVGLVAAILLLGSHLHLQYSRLGMTNIWDPLLVLLALGLLAIAWERSKTAPRQRALWLLAGLALGFCAYGFSSARLLPIILVILFVFVLLFDRQRLRQQAGHLLAALALTLIIALPALLFFRDHDTLYLERANATGIFASQSNWLAQEAGRSGQAELTILQDQFWQALLAFNGSQDNSPSYYPNTPLLNFGTAVLLAIGFILSLLRLRQLKYSLLVVWLLVTVIFAGVLLVDPPQSHRILIALPAAVLLAAIALVEIAALARSALTPSADADDPSLSTKFLLALVAIAAVLALSDVAFYYGRYPTSHEFADVNTEAAYEIAQYLADLEGDWSAYFYGPPAMYTDFPTFPYLLPQFQKGINFFDVEPGAKAEVTAVPNHVFILLPERGGELPALQNEYPGGTVEAVGGHYRNPLFQVYRLGETAVAPPE